MVNADPMVMCSIRCNAHGTLNPMNFDFFNRRANDVDLYVDFYESHMLVSSRESHRAEPFQLNEHFESLPQTIQAGSSNSPKCERF